MKKFWKAVWQFLVKPDPASSGISQIRKYMHED